MSSLPLSHRAQRGVTLIELIVVIVILGILAAVAVPRFLGLETEARVAAVRSLGGTMQSAASMAHGICLAQNCANGATIVMDGQSVVFAFGYPNNASIAKLLQSSEGFTVATSTFTKTGAKTASCWVKYAQPVAASAAPIITYHAIQIIDSTTEAAVNTDLHTQC